MAEIAAQITCVLDGNRQSIILDTINDVNIGMSSTLTTHPIVNGDVVADHMYKEPINLTISGTFGLNGGQGIVVTSAGPKLANIQSLFERIKNEAVMCDIIKTTVDLKDNGVRFQERRNMVLTSISWTERVNSLGFSFGFTQIMTVEIQTLDVDTEDEFLPSTTELQTLNFTDVILDWNEVNNIVISAGVRRKIIAQEFLDLLQTYSANALIALGVTGLVAATVVTVLGLVPVAGWIILGVAAVGLLIARVVTAIDAAKNAEKYIDTFKKYNDDKKNQQEVVRFSNFVGDIHKQLQVLNDAIRVWQVGSNEEQEAMITIDNYNYIFEFSKNTYTRQWKLSVKDVDGKEVGQLSHLMASPTSFSDCAETKPLFRTYGYGSYVYLIRTGNSRDTDLRTCYIIASSIHPAEFNQKLEDIIVNAFLR